MKVQLFRKGIVVGEWVANSGDVPMIGDRVGYRDEYGLVADRTWIVETSTVRLFLEDE